MYFHPTGAEGPDWKAPQVPACVPAFADCCVVCRLQCDLQKHHAERDPAIAMLVFAGFSPAVRSTHHLTYTHATAQVEESMTFKQWYRQAQLADTAQGLPPNSSHYYLQMSTGQTSAWVLDDLEIFRRQRSFFILDPAKNKVSFE
jgi:hypothetical protein